MTTQTATMTSHGGSASANTSSGSAAALNGAHSLVTYLQRLVDAPSSARVAMAVGELATAMDLAANNRPFAVAVSAVKSTDRLGETALSLAALWGRWGRPTCLIDLATGSGSLGGAITSTSPDLAGACSQASSVGAVTSISRVHAKIPNAGVIAAGQADVLGLISTGKLAMLVNALKKNHDRIVVAAPAVGGNFPFLSLASFCDRLVISLVRGQTRGGPVTELAEQAMVQGLRPLEAIWYD